ACAVHGPALAAASGAMSRGLSDPSRQAAVLSRTVLATRLGSLPVSPDAPGTIPLVSNLWPSSAPVPVATPPAATPSCRRRRPGPRCCTAERDMSLTAHVGAAALGEMNDGVESGLAIRTAVAADLPALQQVYRAASLSNAGDAPMLLARPEFLVFT